jgi:uncharacterized protein (TIGR03663 family)
MKRGCWAAGLGLLIVAGGLALRLPRLERRPMHGDEAVHAVKFDGLWQTGEYVYDPEEYHGPALYYATLPIVWLGGARTLAETTEATFRLVPVLFGVGLILLLLLVADGLGRGATLAAGALTALSPVLVFYSRYYIQEMLLAFFAFAVIGCGWRYVQSRRIVWAVLAGVGVGLMHATKETCIISYGGMLTALVLTVAWAGRGRSAWKRLWPGAVVWGGRGIRCERTVRTSSAPAEPGCMTIRGTTTCRCWRIGARRRGRGGAKGSFWRWRWAAAWSRCGGT